MSNQITGYARKTLPTLLIFALLAAPATLIAPQPALAAPVFTVNNNADVAYVGDPTRLTNGVCETAPGNNVCTLRAAIMKANHFPGGGVTINIPSGTYTLTIPASGSDDETTGDLNISNSMLVEGGAGFGTIIQGGGASNDRVFHVMTGTLTLLRATIQNGDCTFDPYCDGGGLLVDSGSALVLNNSTVISNTGAYGGGIYNNGSLTLNYGAVTENTGGLGGGGIYNNGSLTLNYGAVTENTGGAGAGILTRGVTTVTNSTIDGNFGIGVGIFCGSCGTKRIVNSTVSNNIGGGVGNFAGAGDPLIMINSTVFGNSSSGDGGGILNGERFFPSTTSLYNVTIAYNSAGTNLHGGGVYNSIGTVNFQNTIIANNVHQTTSPPFNANDDCGGTLISYDYNLVSDTTGCTIAGSVSHNKINVDPNFGVPFQNNGGATQTLALLAGSPAIDAGDNTLGGCKDNLSATLTTDQRGAMRPVNGGIALVCDIGAYEVQRLLHLPLVMR